MSIDFKPNPVVVPKRQRRNGALCLNGQLRGKLDIPGSQHTGRNRDHRTLRLNLSLVCLYRYT